MRILHVVQSYEERVGGGPRFIRRVSEAFASRGHEVHVWTTNAAEGEYFWNSRKQHVEAGEETIAGVHVRRWPVRHLPYHWRSMRLLALVLPRGLKAYVDPPTPLVPGFWRPQLGGTFTPDLVHAASFPLDSLLWPVFLRSRRLGIPFLITPLLHFGRGEADAAEYKRYYGRWHQAEILKNSAAVFVLSPSEAEYAIRSGAAPERTVVLPLGVDAQSISGGCAERFRTKYGIQGPIVLHIATKSESKGTTTLVAAMDVLWQSGCEATLVLIGPDMPCYRTYLATRTKPLPSGRFFDLGYVNEAEKRDALAAATLMAMPSRADALGLVYLEAWVYGKPVIGARAGGVQDLIVDGVDGRLVEFGDVTVLAKTIAELLEDPQAATAMGVRGQRKVLSSYTLDQEYAVLEAVYRAVLDGTSPRLAVDNIIDNPQKPHVPHQEG
ncbi:MAG: glycosyltransferase family 4 protein [Candidatus Zipacnadales bacterium]